ncbi:MAG TPA: DUF3570 domain-containing protein [Mucilaginibacter sp.]|jgi:hypothetical protein|nr:DUF3570 domain-containing protein [Mucilaginibacter sp.]
MKKRYLSVIGFALICRMHAFGQARTDTGVFAKHPVSLYAPVDHDTTTREYNPRALHIDEIDFVSSYYTQTGDHSPVTGGIGTQQVTDFANGINLNLLWYNDANNKNTLMLGLGYDHHSSASAGYVALHGGANPNGTRLYPSVDWTVENSKTGNTFGIGAYYSGEYNYKSKELDVHWTTKTDDKNGEFGVKLQAYLDRVTMILPSEFVPAPAISQPGTTVITTASGNTVVLSSSGQVLNNSKNSLPTSGRNTFTAALSYTQQVSSRFQFSILGDAVAQNGYLGLPFHRVYFSNPKDTDAVEKLPSSRFKFPIGARMNYFLGDNIILRGYYRYYIDSWGIRSNTASLEIPYKVTPFFSISPFYRYYDQTAARYFAPYEVHNVTDAFYTSNYEYSNFHSGFYGIGFRVAPPKGVFGWQNLHDLEIRYGHYSQTTDLVSDVVSLSLGFK